jgi:hypothetical protein
LQYTDHAECGKMEKRGEEGIDQRRGKLKRKWAKGGERRRATAQNRVMSCMHIAWEGGSEFFSACAIHSAAIGLLDFEVECQSRNAVKGAWICTLGGSSEVLDKASEQRGRRPRLPACQVFAGDEKMPKRPIHSRCNISITCIDTS